MRVIPPVAITPSGTFARATTGTYFDRAGAMQTAAIDAQRYDHDPVTGEAEGLLIESAMTNLLLNTAALATQDVTVAAVAHTLSFYGTGTVVLSGAHVASLAGTAAFPVRTTLTFTPEAGTLTCTVTGSVTLAQLEVGSAATSYFPSAGTQGARAAEVITATFLTNVPAPTTTGSNADPALAWSGATTYAIGDEVYLLSSRRKYVARTAHTNKDPTLALPNAPSTDWADNGPMNAYAAIDYLRNTAATYADEVVQVIKPGRRVDSIGIAGALGKKVKVRVYHQNVLAYSDEATMTYRNTLTWYEYVHGSFIYRKVFARFDLPPFTDSIIVVVVERGSSEAELGAVGLGMSEYIGQIQFEADDDALNFSKINRNSSGDAALVPSRSVARTIQAIYLDKARVNRVRKIRDDLNAAPAFWSGLDDDTHGYYESLFILGIYRKLSINLKHEEVAILSAELEEV